MRTFNTPAELAVATPQFVGEVVVAAVDFYRAVGLTVGAFEAVSSTAPLAASVWSKFSVDLTSGIAAGFFNVDDNSLEITIAEVPQFTFPRVVVLNQVTAPVGPAAVDLAALTYSIGYRDGTGIHAAEGIFPLNAFTVPPAFVVNTVTGILIPAADSKIVLVLTLTDAAAIEDYELTAGALDVWILKSVLPTE